jgi:hypothetical protein
MADLRSVALVVRLMTECTVVNLQNIPTDKLDWKPTPEAKSALQVAGEIVGVMQMAAPTFAGGSFTPAALPHPTSLDEAVTQLTEAAKQYAAALDAAGDELERPVDSPFGTMWASKAVLFGMIDLLHHNGQLAYIQSLLGDDKMHFPETLGKWFGPPEDAAAK